MEHVEAVARVTALGWMLVRHIADHQPIPSATVME
jgi:hypothetical protein